jgi:hypothetical protein
MYETFKGDIEDACRKRSCCWTKEERQDHDAYVEVVCKLAMIYLNNLIRSIG